ncbi:MAG: PAS domain S-box protein, partial [Synergistaceae bacterium]|nr:PAS domain S-box protein [Synergistaceae bacterium]
MEQNISVALLNNATLLLALCVIYEVIYLLPSKYRRMQPIFNGLLIALICIAVMSVPFTFSPYIVFDTRTILISVTALIFGIIPTVITVVMASIFRVSLGGVGLLPGLATITTSAIIGLAWRRWLYPKSTKWAWLNIYAMSVTIHISMLACMLLLAYPNNLNVIRQIALPVMLIYPIATVLLSSLLIRQEKLRLSQDQLKQSEERFKLLFDQAPLAYQSLDIDGRFTAVNQQWLDTFGYSRGEVIGKWFGDFLSPINREVFNQNFPIFKA